MRGRGRTLSFRTKVTLRKFNSNIYKYIKGLNRSFVFYNWEQNLKKNCKISECFYLSLIISNIQKGVKVTTGY